MLLVRPRGTLGDALREREREKERGAGAEGNHQRAGGGPPIPDALVAARPTSPQRSGVHSRPSSAARRLLDEGAAHAAGASAEGRVLALEQEVLEIRQTHAQRELEWREERAQLEREVAALRRAWQVRTSLSRRPSAARPKPASRTLNGPCSSCLPKAECAVRMDSSRPLRNAGCCT